MQQDNNAINFEIRKLSNDGINELASLSESTDVTEVNHSAIIQISINALLKYEMYREHCFVAYHGTKLIGYIYGGVLCDTLYPQHLYVHPLYRKNGVASALLNKLEITSGCLVSAIYFDEDLSEFYRKKDYAIGYYKIGMKDLDGECN